MKTENTLENKAKFFALYFNQNVMRDNQTTTKRLYPCTWGNIEFEPEHAWLDLTPLSQITDEDAMQVARFAHQTPTVDFEINRVSENLIHATWLAENIQRELHISINEYGCINANCRFLKTEHDDAQSFKVNIGEIQTSSMRAIPYIIIVDFLRSKGYAIPYLDLSIKDLISYGWVKLKENNKID